MRNPIPGVADAIVGSKAPHAYDGDGLHLRIGEVLAASDTAGSYNVTLGGDTTIIYGVPFINTPTIGASALFLQEGAMLVGVGGLS